MDAEEFRKHGKEMVDFVAEYWENIRKRTPLPNVKPGYMKSLIPCQLPNKTQDWETIFSSLEEVVMKGDTNWNHPLFFAYYPASCSYAAILADILCDGINPAGLTWKSNPSLTELEMKVLDWLVELFGLPEYFKCSHPGPGCGVTQSTASEATMLAIMNARARIVDVIKHNPSLLPSCENLRNTVKQLLEDYRRNIVYEEDKSIITPHYHDPTIFRRLIAYCSDQAHLSIEKGAMLCGVKIRMLKSDFDPNLKNYTVTKQTLETAIQEDRARGLIPFIMIATVGTTSTCGVDRLDQLGPICNREFLYLHVDAAYIGSFLVCPEFRHFVNGVELVDSFNFNAHKGLLSNFGVSPMWFKDGVTAAKYFSMGKDLSEDWSNTPNSTLDMSPSSFRDHILQHLRTPSGRRSHALKFYFVLRSLGVEFLQQMLRKQADLAALFGQLVTESEEFELVVPPVLGLACFRIKNSTNIENQALCNAINEDRRIHLGPASVHGLYILRLAICSQLTTEDDIRFTFDVCKEILANLKSC